MCNSIRFSKKECGGYVLKICVLKVDSSTVWKVSVFGVILVRISPHLDWIQRDISPYSVHMRENIGQNNSEPLCGVGVYYKYES